MKLIALIAATGSLAAMTAPAAAADFAAPIGVVSEVTHTTTAGYGDPPPHARAYGRRDRDYRDYRRYERRYDRRGYDDDGYYDDRRYDDRRYDEPRRLSRRDRIWRGRDGRYYCERSDGTTGLVVGAALGALAGRAIDTRGDRTTGTLLGALFGGLLGREVDRGELRCR